MRGMGEQSAGLAAKLASQFLDALETRRLVENFIENYATEFSRLGLMKHPVRHRELAATLSRETLLAMGAKASTELPRIMAGGRTREPTTKQTQAVDQVRDALVAAFAERLEWSAAETESFHADLCLYARLTARTPRSSRRPRRSDSARGPFVDRCALLLDPSMLEKARAAAGKFQAEIDRITKRILTKVFHSRPRIA